MVLVHELTESLHIKSLTDCVTTSILVFKVMMGGAWFQEEFGVPEAVAAECLLARATKAVSCHLGVTAAPIWSHVALHKVQQHFGMEIVYFKPNYDLCFQSKICLH